MTMDKFWPFNVQCSKLHIVSLSLSLPAPRCPAPLDTNRTQDTPRCTHLKCKTGYSSEDNILLRGTLLMKLCPSNGCRRGPIKQLFALDF